MLKDEYNSKNSVFLFNERFIYDYLKHVQKIISNVRNFMLVSSNVYLKFKILFSRVMSFDSHRVFAIQYS